MEARKQAISLLQQIQKVKENLDAFRDVLAAYDSTPNISASTMNKPSAFSQHVGSRSSSGLSPGAPAKQNNRFRYDDQDSDDERVLRQKKQEKQRSKRQKMQPDSFDDDNRRKKRDDFDGNKRKQRGQNSGRRHRKNEEFRLSSDDEEKPQQRRQRREDKNNNNKQPKFHQKKFQRHHYLEPEELDVDDVDELFSSDFLDELEERTRKEERQHKSNRRKNEKRRRRENSPDYGKKTEIPKTELSFDSEIEEILRKTDKYSKPSPPQKKDKPSQKNNNNTSAKNSKQPSKQGSNQAAKPQKKSENQSNHSKSGKSSILKQNKRQELSKILELSHYFEERRKVRESMSGSPQQNQQKTQTQISDLDSSTLNSSIIPPQQNQKQEKQKPPNHHEQQMKKVKETIQEIPSDSDDSFEFNPPQPDRIESHKKSSKPVPEKKKNSNQNKNQEDKDSVQSGSQQRRKTNAKKPAKKPANPKRKKQEPVNEFSDSELHDIHQKIQDLCLSSSTIESEKPSAGQKSIPDEDLKFIDELDIPSSINATVSSFSEIDSSSPEEDENEKDNNEEEDIGDLDNMEADIQDRDIQLSESDDDKEEQNTEIHELLNESDSENSDNQKSSHSQDLGDDDFISNNAPSQTNKEDDKNDPDQYQVYVDDAECLTNFVNDDELFNLEISD